MGVWYVAQRMGIISLLALILLGASPCCYGGRNEGSC